VPEHFGPPDASRQPLSEGFVLLRPGYGAIGQEITEFTRARVVVGAQGVGKTLFLRRLESHFRRDSSVITTPLVMHAWDLGTDAVIRFSQLSEKATATEAWARVWRRAIEVAAASILTSSRRGKNSDEAMVRLEDSLTALGMNPRSTHSAPSAVARIVEGIGSRSQLRNFVVSEKWDELSAALGRALDSAPPVYVFIDAIDDNFRFSVSHWTLCQRGLFYATMNLDRSPLRNRLHAVISLRDVIFDPLARGEHGMRLTGDPSIVPLVWTMESAKDFLRGKVAQLPDELFPPGATKDVQGLLGRVDMRRPARDACEDVEDYLVRHTRFAPRELIILGNELIARAGLLRCRVSELPDLEIQRVATGVARLSARSAVALVANQIASDALPWTSARRDFVEAYTFEDEGLDGLIRELSSILLTARTERIRREDVLGLDEEAQRRFGSGVRLSDVLWRGQLLGAVADDGAGEVFHAGISISPDELPDANEYVLNSIISSLVGIVPDRLGPHYPGGGK